jgi:hypothetical protein
VYRRQERNRSRRCRGKNVAAPPGAASLWAPGILSLALIWSYAVALSWRGLRPGCSGVGRRDCPRRCCCLVIVGVPGRCLHCYGSCRSLRLRQLVGVGVPALVGLLSAVLVAASPERPGVAVRLVAARLGDDGPAQLPQQLGNGDRDQPVGAEIPSPYATWEYSWIRPPSRSRRRTRDVAPGAGGCGRPAGGPCCSVRCGRWEL